jgi:hypothetical protein
MRLSRRLAVLCSLVALSGVIIGAQNPRDLHNTGPEHFSKRVVASRLGNPWEVTCDMAFSPDGGCIFLSTDDHGATQDGAGNRTDSLENPGAILEFTVSPAT